MNRVAAVVVNNVIRDESTEAPILTGRLLYEALATQYRLVLIADEYLNLKWLTMNNFTEHQAIIERLPEDPQDTPIRRIRQIQRMRARGLAPQILIEPDPAVVAAVIHMGVPCLHYVDPPYGRPEFHPDYQETIVPWESMVEQIDKVRAARASDTRHLEED